MRGFIKNFGEWMVGIGLAILATACAPGGGRESPLLDTADINRLTPTPRPAATAAANDASIASSQPTPQSALDIVGRDTIYMADWDEKSLNLQNNLLGYLMVYGYNYTVELTTVGDEGYRSGLEAGEIDIVLQVDTSEPDTKTWFDDQVEAGTILDVGSLSDSAPEVRIAANSSMKSRAPDVLEMLGKAKPGDEAVAPLAARISFGRIGFLPNVAALTYMKENPTVWPMWITAEARGKVDQAVEDGKTSLRNRSCIPQGVERGDCGRN